MGILGALLLITMQQECDLGGAGNSTANVVPMEFARDGYQVPLLVTVTQLII